MLRCDDLGNGFHIWQDTELFAFGVDAVLLAHFPKIMNGDRILDLGTGTGPIPLILAAEARKADIAVDITGLEIQEPAASLAARSVAENGLSEEVHIINGDLREAGTLFKRSSFSMITCNPPYMAAGEGLVGQNDALAAARTELKCTLHDVVQTAGQLLQPGGRFAMIHRPFRIPEILDEMRRAGLAAKRMRLVHPYAGAEATMVLIEARRGGRPYLRCGPPLVIYKDGRQYTDEILEIYGMKRS